MFITSNATPAELLSQLIEGPATPISSEFKPYLHNKDLCPRFQERAEQILNAYARHRASVDDIQGFTDQGVDILLQYSDESGTQHSIGLQVKSYREIENDLKLEPGKRTLISSLFAQRTRAQSKHRVEKFYIVLCGDGEKEKHADFVRRVKAEFTSISDVRVITPGQAWAFLNRKDHEIAAYCAKILCAEDYVLREVVKEFAEEPDAFRRIIVAWTVNQLEGNSDMDIDDLIGYASDDDECDQARLLDQVATVVGDLEFNNDVENINGERFRLIRNDRVNLSALYFDLRARHGLCGQDAIDYLWSVTA